MFERLSDSIASFFRSSPPPTPAADETTPRDALAAIEGALATALVDADTAAAAASTARDAVDPAAHAERDATKRVLDAIEAGAADAQIDELQRAAERERLRHALAVRRADEATAAADAAKDHAEELERAIDEARNAIALDEAADAASVDTFHARTAPHFDALFAALAEVEKHAGAIDTIFAESNAAADRCRKGGRAMPDLDKLHLVAPVALARGIVPKDDGIRSMREAMAWSNLRATLLEGLKKLEDAGRAWTEQERFHPQRITEITEVMLKSRTWLGAREALAEHQRAAKDDATTQAAASQAAELARRADYEATQRRLIGPAAYDEAEARRAIAREVAARSCSAENIGEPMPVAADDDEASAAFNDGFAAFTRRSGPRRREGRMSSEAEPRAAAGTAAAVGDRITAEQINTGAIPMLARLQRWHARVAA